MTSMLHLRLVLRLDGKYLPSEMIHYTTLSGRILRRL